MRVWFVINWFKFGIKIVSNFDLNFGVMLEIWGVNKIFCIFYKGLFLGRGFFLKIFKVVKVMVLLFKVVIKLFVVIEVFWLIFMKIVLGVIFLKSVWLYKCFVVLVKGRMFIIMDILWIILFIFFCE